MSSTLQNLLISTGLILVLALGYFLYIQNERTGAQDTAVNNIAAVETSDFLTRLRDLETIKINDEIFSDPNFTNLINFSEEVTELPYGKINPFSETNY